MKQVGVVICNYNKADYVLLCIQSVLESVFQDFDVYVVDNASSDDSVKKIKEKYGDRVQVIENKENLGGSGGFNTGIRKVVDMGYPYLMCLDNDAQIDENAMEASLNFLKENSDVGMVGSKVYHLQQPAYIQQMGLKIDFRNFGARTMYADTLDTEDIPEVVYCDTVAACSVMLPCKVVKEVGPMPEDNFIYWDDMEWGFRIKKAGYKVAAIGASRAVHEMGANVRKENTFSNYYLWRNSLDFFMRNCHELEIEKMADKMLENVFDAVYEAEYREEKNVAKTLKMALEDAINGVRGKAPEGRIFENDGNINRFREFAGKYTKFYVENNDEFIVNCIKEINEEAVIVDNEKNAQCVIAPCHYIMYVNDFSRVKAYVDSELNVMFKDDEIEKVKDYPRKKEAFIREYREKFIEKSQKFH